MTDVDDYEPEEDEVVLDKGNFEELMIAMMKDIKKDLEEIKSNQK